MACAKSSMKLDQLAQFSGPGLVFCWNGPMGAQENWLAHLRKIVEDEGRTPSGTVDDRAGYRAVSSATGISEEYIYQLCKGIPNRDGSPRMPGTRLRAALARAYGAGRPDGWIDLPPTSPRNITEPRVGISIGERGAVYNAARPAPSAGALLLELVRACNTLDESGRSLAGVIAKTAMERPDEAETQAKRLDLLLSVPGNRAA